MERLVIFFSFIVLEVFKLLIFCVGILVFSTFFAPILLFVSENSFLRVINKLHELINNQ